MEVCASGSEAGALLLAGAVQEQLLQGGPAVQGTVSASAGVARGCAFLCREAPLHTPTPTHPNTHKHTHSLCSWHCSWPALSVARQVHSPRPWAWGTLAPPVCSACALPVYVCVRALHVHSTCVCVCACSACALPVYVSACSARALSLCKDYRRSNFSS